MGWTFVKQMNRQTQCKNYAAKWSRLTHQSHKRKSTASSSIIASNIIDTNRYSASGYIASSDYPDTPPKDQNENTNNQSNISYVFQPVLNPNYGLNEANNNGMNAIKTSNKKRQKQNERRVNYKQYKSIKLMKKRKKLTASNSNGPPLKKRKLNHYSAKEDYDCDADDDYTEIDEHIHCENNSLQSREKQNDNALNHPTLSANKQTEKNWNKFAFAQEKISRDAVEESQEKESLDVENISITHEQSEDDDDDQLSVLTQQSLPQLL